MYKKVEDAILKSSNIPSNLKGVVLAICNGYIRETDGNLPYEGIINVCNATYIEHPENDKEFLGKYGNLATTEVNYDENLNVSNILEYTNFANPIKTITLLTHELGHVMTNFAPNNIIKISETEKIFMICKCTGSFYLNCSYDDNDNLCAASKFGFCFSDGFLETMGMKIFKQEEFRKELKEIGYDLGDYVYKDKRLFPSRMYDEYQKMFVLYDYIFHGELFPFCYSDFKNDSELLNYIRTNKLEMFLPVMDECSIAFSLLKEYEGKESDERFLKLFADYLEKRKAFLLCTEEMCELERVSLDDPKYIELLSSYLDNLSTQELLPLPSEFRKPSSTIPLIS